MAPVLRTQSLLQTQRRGKPLSNRIRPLLLAVIALPILGGWSCARAGYIALVPVITGPAAGLSTIVPNAADLDDPEPAVTYGEPACEIGPIPDAQGATQGFVDGLPYTGVNAGARRAVTGRCAPSGDSGDGESDSVPGETGRPRIDSPAQIGVLFRQASAFRPPPFSSRIFRPPRRA